MAGSSFGTIFKITTWGESHGKALGVVIDGCPSGLPLCENDIQIFLNERRPGQNNITTKRDEKDEVEILSGVFEGVTTGTPISLVIKNTSQISKDYNDIASYYRPGHADYTFDAKYGFRDYRGGGRSSGRETIGRVAAGAVAIKILNSLGINILAYTRSIGPITIDYSHFDETAISNTITKMPDYKSSQKAEAFLKETMEQSDSAGGVIECIVKNMPKGIGDPVFEKLDANLSKAIMSIGAIKAIEIGDGISSAFKYGSENNDSFQFVNEKIEKTSNHAGGILGGISDGDEILIRAYVKPTPSIYKPQKTVNNKNENISISIKGRHDPIIVPRAVVVVKAMTAVTILDSLMMNLSSRIENLENFYKK